ncbi:unnamed protein product [Sphagnum tenellum]
MPFGDLEVYVEGALRIRNASIFGKSSPYCMLTCGTQKFQTPVAKEAGSNPYWNTNFKFKIDRSCQELVVNIFCRNTITADDELAYTSLSFKKIFHDGHVVPLQGFNVLDPSGKLGGEIRMSLIFFSITLDQVSNADQRLSATVHASPYPRRTNPVSAGAPSARRIHEPDADYASRGSTSSTTPHLLKEVQFCSNEDRYSFQDSRSPHQAYTEESYHDNDSAWSGSPNVRHKPKDQWHVQQHDHGAQASLCHHTSGGNPRHHPGQHYNPASPQITPRLTGHRSREEHVKYGVTASRLVAKPPQKLFGPNHHQLPDVHQQQERAPPVRQQAPELEPQSQLAPSALQRRPPPGKFPVSVQPKLLPDQRISIPGELDKEGPVYKQIQVANSRQPQHTYLNSKDTGSESDRTANSMKSKSSDNSAKMESRRSQASPVPKIVNEVAPAIPPMKKSSQTLLNTPDNSILQSPGSRASSFQSGQSIQSPTAKREEAPTRHHPGLDPPGSDSDVDEYEAKHYIDEEFDLTQQYVGEYETSGHYNQEEDMDNNEYREENDDYENYEQEDEEDSEGYVTRTAVPFKGHSRALGDYPLHEQDNDEHENYEHEQEYGSEQQEHEEYEEDSLAYNSVVVVPVEGNFRSPGDYTPSGISSHANVRQTPNSNLPPPNSFSGHSRGLYLPSLSHVQTSSHQESQGRILRGQVQRYQVPLGQNYPPENSPLRNKPQQSAASQAVSYQDPNKRHQVDIVSKSTHRLLENCSIDDPSPDHAKRSQDLIPPTRGHLHQKSHPHNPPF